jgi:hypothetical protein
MQSKILNWIIPSFIVAGLVITISHFIIVIIHPAPMQAEVEEKFTPEQKAVIAACQNCISEMARMQAAIEKSKAEFAVQIAVVHAEVIVKSMNTNIPIYWFTANEFHTIGVNRYPIWIGLREDGVLIWKRP